MSSLARSIPIFFPLARTAPIAVLIGAAILACPLAAAQAEGVKTGPAIVAQTTPPKVPPVMPVTADKPETIEARITDLRDKLQITVAETPKWNDVAKAMRDNAAQMEKLVADKKVQAGQGMTAADDLMTYQKFAQAHVDGLKRLTASFKTLYDSMPSAQKLVADKTFMNFGRSPPPANG